MGIGTRVSLRETQVFLASVFRVWTGLSVNANDLTCLPARPMEEAGSETSANIHREYQALNQYRTLSDLSATLVHLDSDQSTEEELPGYHEGT